MGGEVSHQALYNIPLEGTKQKGFTPIYRNSSSIDKLPETPQPNFTSMKDAIYDSMKRNKNKHFLGKISIKTLKNGENTTQERQLTKFTYSQIFDMAEKVGSFLLNNKLEYNQSLSNMKLIGIFAKNRYEWIVSDMACILYGLTIVPLYETLGIDNLTYCLEHSGLTTLFVSAGTIKTLLKLKGHGNLQNLICMDLLTPQIQDELKNHKFRVFHFSDTLKQTKIIDHHLVKVEGKNCLTFSYTSGTTGLPKGAMLSHANFLAFLASIKVHEINGFRQDDSYVSFLPLPHIFERVIVAALTYRGCFIAFYSGDMLKIKDDIAFVKPTILVAVPRIFNRIVQNVEKTFSQSAKSLKGWIISNGIKSKMEYLHQSGQFSSYFYDPLVFSKVKEKFGGRIRLMITGGAPIKKQVFDWMKILMSCPFYQGYSQTQCTGAAFINNASDITSGHVGGIVAALQFKLNDIEQMHYTSQDKDQHGKPTPRGQIWLRGPLIFMGYYKDKEKTQQAITADGWLKTGDIGMLLPGSNAIRIIDRKKNIFKLQQGQYVAAQKVEDVYSRSHLISQLFIYGQPLHNFAVAIVVPQKEQLLKLAKKHQIKGNYEQLCKDQNMKTIFCKQMDRIGKQQGLMSFEQAKNLYLESEPFLNRGILSSTMKMQRFAARKFYSKQIEAMYNEGPINLK